MPFAEAFREPVRAAIAKSEAGSGHKIYDGTCDEHFARLRQRGHARADFADQLVGSVRAKVTFAGVQPNLKGHV